MKQTDLVEAIKSQIAEEGPLGEDVDLDRIKSNHKKHMLVLTNIYEIITHKMVLLIVSLVVVFIWLFTRYFRLYKDWPILEALNKDTSVFISYYVTAVASWFVTKHLEKKD